MPSAPEEERADINRVLADARLDLAYVIAGGNRRRASGCTTSSPTADASHRLPGGLRCIGRGRPRPEEDKDGSLDRPSPGRRLRAWRRVYDDFQASGVPAERGVRAHAVYQGVDDPNDVTVTHDFDDADTAKAFFSSDDSKGAMRPRACSPTACRSGS